MLSVGELFVGMSHGVVPGGTDLVCLEISMGLVVSSFMEELPFLYQTTLYHLTMEDIHPLNN